MPFETISAFQDHGVVRPGTLTEGVEEAHSAPARPRRRGRRLRRRHRHTLEREGVQKFSDSFASLLEGIDAKRAVLA